MLDELSALRRGDPAQHLPKLRFYAFKQRLHRINHAAYLRAKQIVDGESPHDEAAGKKLMEQIDELRKQAPVIDPDNKTAADYQLSEAFLEANHIWRGKLLSLRLGHYLHHKKR